VFFFLEKIVISYLYTWYIFSLYNYYHHRLKKHSIIYHHFFYIMDNLYTCAFRLRRDLIVNTLSHYSYCYFIRCNKRKFIPGITPWIGLRKDSITSRCHSLYTDLFHQIVHVVASGLEIFFKL